MGPLRERPILIAGGGIGGLAAALGLAQKGFRSILMEKATALGEIGAGIQLGPNAFHAFDYLGVGEAARGMGPGGVKPKTPPSSRASEAPTREP